MHSWVALRNGFYASLHVGVFPNLRRNRPAACDRTRPFGECFGSHRPLATNYEPSHAGRLNYGRGVVSKNIDRHGVAKRCIRRRKPKRDFPII